MKTLLWTSVLAAFLALTACNIKTASAARRTPNANPVIVRAHFIGTEQLFASPEAATIKEAWSAQSASDFRNEILNRTALLPSFWLGDVLGRSTASQSNLFRPLLDDVLARECYVDCTAAPDFMLAVQVPEERARVWQTNLWQALVNWNLGQPAALKSGPSSGFELKHAGLPGVFRCLRAGQWIVVSAGSSGSARETEVLANIKSTGRPAKPTGAWLDGDANLARFDGWLPILANFENLPTAHFSLSNRADFVRTYTTLDFPKPHGWKPELWQIPTNALRDPLISFMAVRGVAPVLEALPSIRGLGYSPTPNQIIGWGNAGVPFQLNYAAPSTQARPQLKAMAPKLKDLVDRNTSPSHPGQIHWDTNGQEIVWSGFPAAFPHLGSTTNGRREYLAMGLFPPNHLTNPPPAGLLQALYAHGDMVAFDFEITAERLIHWRQAYQLLEIASKTPLAQPTTPFFRWVDDAKPKLGEAVTELRVSSPSQMTLVRKSTLGLTGAEIVTLGRWLESTNFPAFGVFQAGPDRRGPPGRNPPPIRK